MAPQLDLGWALEQGRFDMVRQVSQLGSVSGMRRARAEHTTIEMAKAGRALLAVTPNLMWLLDAPLGAMERDTPAWIIPPPALLPQALESFRRWGGWALWMVPRWPAAPWMATLRTMAVGEPISVPHQWLSKEAVQETQCSEALDRETLMQMRTATEQEIGGAVSETGRGDWVWWLWILFSPPIFHGEKMVGW